MGPLLLALAAAPAFTEVAEALGLDYLQHAPNVPPGCLFLRSACEPERLTGGAATGDVDGDGDLDLVVTRLDAPILLYCNQLRQTGVARFVDCSAAAGGFPESAGGNGALLFDADGDRDLDLYVTTVAKDRYPFYVNDGAGRFREDGDRVGLAFAGGEPRIGTGITAGDLDGDGHVDLVISEWRPVALAPSGEPSRNRALLGRPDGRFVDATSALGLRLEPPADAGPRAGAWGFAAAIVDLDLDGRRDLWFVRDFGDSLLYFQDDGGFVDHTRTASVGTDENGMGLAVADVDQDGDLDVFVSSIYDPADTCAGGRCTWGRSGNRLYENLGGRRFADATDRYGVRDAGWGWGAAFFDPDSDGDLDLVVTNGVDYPQYPIEDAFHADATRLFVRDGPRFVEAAAAAGMADRRAGKGLLVFDFDGDLDQDVLIVNNADRPLLYRNDTPLAGRALRITLTGAPPNTEALGAVVEVEREPGGPIERAEVGVATHFLGQSERTLHFGLGPRDRCHRVVVRFPSGRTVELLGLAAPQHLFVDEALGARDPRLASAAGDGASCGLTGPEVALLLALLRRRRSRRAG